jgi:ring-1,2-phenylacetyl-CoA epoxidase subunit PaaE
MGLFDKLFGKKVKPKKSKEAVLKIKEIVSLTEDAVKVTFDVPNGEKFNYSFVPGQYLDLEVEIDGEKLHRSYSICSDIKEPLSIGVKKVEDGKVSTWLNDSAKAGDEISVAFPQGNFTIAKADGDYVAFAAGSGITPILSIAKFFSRANDSKLLLFYGNKNEDTIMFKDELEDLENVEVRHVLSRQEKEGTEHGRLNTEKVRDMIKKDLDILKSKGFYLCGPEQMILNVSDVLKTFGVPEEKIHYELFTTPTLMKSKQKETVADFEGVSKVTVILDEEEEKFDLESNGATILDEAESYGIEAPFSCRGGVCCSCKAKVLKGAVTMDKNFTLTDSEIEEGFILTCQSHPNSEELTITYDD